MAFGKVTSTLVKRMSFCILGKISAVQLTSSQSNQASRSTSRRNFRIVESTNLNLPRKPHCHLNLDELLSIFQLEIRRRDSVMMLYFSC